MRNAEGQRPVFGGARKFQEDPYWRDHLLFYEYFHGDNGAGVGANHQTGWTGVVARGMDLFACTTPEQILEFGKRAFVEVAGLAESGAAATARGRTQPGRSTAVDVALGRVRRDCGRHLAHARAFPSGDRPYRSMASP